MNEAAEEQLVSSVGCEDWAVTSESLPAPTEDLSQDTMPKLPLPASGKEVKPKFTSSWLQLPSYLLCIDWYICEVFLEEWFS
jgi:hypothetical protein